MAAEDGGATGDPDRAEGASVGEARLAGATVDKQLLLLAAHIAPRVAVSVHRASAIRDRELQRFAHGLVEPARGLLAHCARLAARAEARTVKRLVGVDVAHSGDGA